MLTDSADVGSNRISTAARIEGLATVVLAAEGPRGGFFTSRDRQIVENIGRLFSSWAGGALQRTLSTQDRRAVSRSFEDLLEHTALQAAARGTSSSVVVIQMNDAGFPLTHKVAADLRPHLRAGESVGVLGAGEIGLLLYDSKPDVVRLVVGRLRCAVSGPENGGLFASAAVGVAHCPEGSAPIARLVPVARENARTGAQQIGTIS